VLDWQETLLHDPQTSGGLLVAVTPERADVFLAFCGERDEPTWVIGDVAKGAGIEIL
jgi:selenide,water dikinase